MIDHRSYAYSLSGCEINIYLKKGHGSTGFMTSAIPVQFHLYSSPSTGLLRTHNAPSWLDSSVGRALDLFRRGHVFIRLRAVSFFS